MLVDLNTTKIGIEGAITTQPSKVSPPDELSSSINFHPKEIPICPLLIPLGYLQLSINIYIFTMQL